MTAVIIVKKGMFKRLLWEHWGCYLVWRSGKATLRKWRLNGSWKDDSRRRWLGKKGRKCILDRGNSMCRDTERRSSMFMELKEFQYGWCLRCEGEWFRISPT